MLDGQQLRIWTGDPGCMYGIRPYDAIRVETALGGAYVPPPAERHPAAASFPRLARAVEERRLRVLLRRVQRSWARALAVRYHLTHDGGRLIASFV